MRHIAVSATSGPAAAATVEVTQSPTMMAGQPRSPWHSPVPYLFGGLAAMLGLIAFALLILACSYWRLSATDRPEDDGDVESQKEGGDGGAKTAKVYEEKFVVIMAGNEKPTFLATPVSNNKLKGCSFRNDDVVEKRQEEDKIESEVKVVVVKEEEMGSGGNNTVPANYTEESSGTQSNGGGEETQQEDH